MSNYDIWKDKVSSNFVGQISDVVSKVYRKVTHGWTLKKLESQNLTPIGGEWRFHNSEDVQKFM